jgi:hypothetical protein
MHAGQARGHAPTRSIVCFTGIKHQMATQIYDATSCISLHRASGCSLLASTRHPTPERQAGEQGGTCCTMQGRHGPHSIVPQAH